MAIVVEEDKKKTSAAFSIIGWLIFLATAAAAVYYVFFTTPQAASLEGSGGGLAAIAPLINAPIQPASVQNNASLQSFATSIPAPSPTSPAGVGDRANPFIAP